MGPVFEHALVDALRLLQIGAAIGGDAAVEDVMVAALDHIDGVDLHIAEMLDRGRASPPAPRRTAPAYPAAGRAARCAGPGSWSEGGERSCGASRRQCSRIRAAEQPALKRDEGRALALCMRMIFSANASHFADASRCGSCATASPRPDAAGRDFRPRRRPCRGPAPGICRRCRSGDRSARRFPRSGSRGRHSGEPSAVTNVDSRIAAAIIAAPIRIGMESLEPD